MKRGGGFFENEQGVTISVRLGMMGSDKGLVVYRFGFEHKAYPQKGIAG